MRKKELRGRCSAPLPAPASAPLRSAWASSRTRERALELRRNGQRRAIGGRRTAGRARSGNRTAGGKATLVRQEGKRAKKTPQGVLAPISLYQSIAATYQPRRRVSLPHLIPVESSRSTIAVKLSSAAPAKSRVRHKSALFSVVLASLLTVHGTMPPVAVHVP